MLTLEVKDVPEELYERLKQLAAERNLSLSVEVVTLLERAVQADDSRPDRGKLLEEIRRRRHVFPPELSVPDCVELLREDRAR